MSTVEKSIRLYAWKSNYQTVQMVQGEMDSRTFRIQLFDTTAPVDLTRCSVKLYAVKPDSTKVYLNCEPVDAKNGIVEVVIEEQVAAVPGVVNCWIQVVGDGGTDLRFEGLYLEISECDLDGAIESTGSKDDMRAFLEESARLAEVQNEVRSARMGNATLEGKERAQDQALADTASAIRREMDANDVDVRNDFANADAVLQSHINAEKARIDQLTASPEIGEGDLEKEMGDLRVGDDGVTYGSAGTMARTRLSVRNVKAVKITELPDVVLPVQEVQQAIEQKGEEVLKSLPEDYTELVEEVEEIYKQFAETLKYIKTDKTDLNEMLDIGFYTKGSSTIWTNMPSGLTDVSCVLIAAGRPGLNNHTCQLLITHTNEVYVRYFNYNSGKMGNWSKVYVGTNEFELAVMAGHHASGNSGDSVDLNDVIKTGYYFYGSGTALTNAPTELGTMLVLKGRSDYNVYQLWFDYYGGLYTRNYIYNQGFSNWRQISYVSAEEKVSEKPYSIAKVDDSTFYIYKKGVKGYIRYTYKRQTNSNINLDTWRLYEIQICDKSKTVLKTLSQAGADLEGVVLLNGEADHIGGIHGDEQSYEYFIFVNGKQYTFENIPDIECDEIRIIVASSITHADTDDVCMNKIKHTTFDRSGVHISCEWEALEVLNIKSIRSCMFSIYKNCFTHYYDSRVNRIPILCPEESSSSSKISEDAKMTDIFYIGDVCAHHWAGERGGDSSGLSTLIQDYGSRLKSYFNCYDGHTTTVGEKMYAENHFNVEY